MKNTNLIWQAPEFTTQKKNTLWYVGFTVITLGLLAYGWFSHNLLTLFTFIAIIGIAYFFSHQKPQQIEYELTTTNIRIGKSRYPYRNVRKFWVIFTLENKTVNFETTAYINNQITLQLGKQDPVLVRDFLKNYLPEDLDQEESLTDIISRKIKF